MSPNLSILCWYVTNLIKLDKYINIKQYWSKVWIHKTCSECTDIQPLKSMVLMFQSHCVESTPEWGGIDNSSLFRWSFLVIPGHSSNDNENDNQFEHFSSRPCSFGRSVWKFWTCSKSLSTQQCPAQILFICSYAHWKRVVIFFVAQLTCCILVIVTVFVVVLTVYYVIRTDSETGADQKTVQTMMNGAAKYIFVLIRVHIRVNSPLSYTWHVDSYIFLLFSYSIRFIFVCSCEMQGRTE